MARENVLEGVFAINKPMGMSSAQVIRDCQTFFNPSDFFRPLIQKELDMRSRESNAMHRRRSKAKRDMRVKMGHGGTLDPLATGVLILGIGRGTKELNKFLTCTKTYETVVLFGASTDTYDRVGRVLCRKAYDEITKEKVEKAIEDFRGKFRQMPPLYSALKMNGKPLYEYAREGLSIPREIETREVDVTDIELVEWYEPGTHNHRWPEQEAGIAEQNLAEKVWRMEKEQEQGGASKRTPEQEQSDLEAEAAYEDFKRKAEEKQDELVFDRPTKRRRGPGGSPLAENPKGRKKDELLMSGALGELPSSPYHDNKISKSNEEKDAENEADLPSAPKESAESPKAAGKKGARDAKMQMPGKHGANLIPPPPSADTPPPWKGKGPPACRVRMTVSSGFYVRSFCHDLGEKVGSVAMMAELARTRQSDFRVGTANMLEYEDISKGEKVWAPKLERLLRLWEDNEVAKGAVLEEGELKAQTEEADVSSSATAEATPVVESSEAKADDESEWNGFDEAEKPAAKL